MSIKRQVAVWENSQHSGSTLLALLSLADRADDDGYCWPSHADTAKRARVKRSYVASSIIPKLIESGELFQLKRSGYSSKYIVLEGLSAHQVSQTMKRKLRLNDDVIAVELQRISENMKASGRDVQTFDLLKDLTPLLKLLTGGVNASKHEPSITISESSNVGEEVAPVSQGSEQEKEQAGQSPEPDSALSMFGLESGNGKSPAKPKKPASKKKERDPLLDHPAIKAYRHYMRFHVPIALRQDVVDLVGDSEAENQKWSETVKTWLGFGYNPRSVEKIMGVFKEGGADVLRKRARGNGNGHGGKSVGGRKHKEEDYGGTAQQVIATLKTDHRMTADDLKQAIGESAFSVALANAEVRALLESRA